MNYTEHYHLPQWAEDDRILRTDFNQMCLNTDKGIAGAAAAWDGLFWTGRRQLDTLWPQMNPTAVYCANGLFYNPLASAALAQTLSGVQWKENKGICSGRGDAIDDETILRTTCVEYKPGNAAGAVNSEDACSIYDFIAPQTCVIRKCSFFLYLMFTGQLPSIQVEIAVTAEKKTGSTFTEIYRKVYSVDQAGTSTARVERFMDLEIPLEKNQEYRLKMQLTERVLSTVVPGRFGFVVDPASESSPSQGYADHSRIWLEEPVIPSGSHTRSFTTEGQATHGLVMLHYNKSGDTASLVPTLGGKAMTLLYSAPRTAFDGQTFQEDWYTCEGSFSGSAQFKVQFQPGSSGKLQLLRYAVLMM